MDEKGLPVYLFITADKTSPEEINELTRELGESLQAFEDQAGEVKYVGKASLPKDIKSAELIFAQQVIIELVPIVTPWVIGKIDVMIKSISARRQRRITATIQVGSREISIAPETTSRQLAQYKEIVKSAETLTNNRYALIIGNSAYSDKALPTLNSAGTDAVTLAEVLKDGRIGAFSDVETLIDQDSHTIKQAIENFFQDRRRDDLLLLYFSGHGIKNKFGQLVLAAQNTLVDALRATGISSNFIRESMDTSESQRQILILDCCYSGAIVQGAKSEQVLGQPMNSIEAFQSTGFGRVIITASEATQYAYDGQRFEGHTENSHFTYHLVEGLKSGNADHDNDGLIEVGELYEYAYENVRGKQTPTMSTSAREGKLFVSINPNPKITPAKLPKELADAPKSSDRVYKLGAIHELGLLFKGEDFRMSMAAEEVLKEFLKDDSKVISNAASDVLERAPRPQPETESKNPRAALELPIVPTTPQPELESKTLIEPQPPEGEESPTQATPPKAKRSPSPVAAAILSFFFVGLGHLLLLGQWKKGLTLILLFLFSLFIPQLGPLLALIIIIYGVIDAYGTAQKLRDGSTVKE